MLKRTKFNMTRENICLKKFRRELQVCRFSCIYSRVAQQLCLIYRLLFSLYGFAGKQQRCLSEKSSRYGWTNKSTWLGSRTAGEVWFRYSLEMFYVLVFVLFYVF
jgi:hypothetical protein